MLLRYLNQTTKLIKIDQVRSFHSIRMSQASQLIYLNQSEHRRRNSSNVQHSRSNQIFFSKNQLLNNQINLMNQMNSVRFSSTETMSDRAIADALKSSIKQQKDAEIDLSNFQIPKLPTADEIEKLKEMITYLDLGMTSWLPPRWLFEFLTIVHDHGVTWPTSIILITILIRLAITPLNISSQRQGIIISNKMREFQKFQEEVQRAQTSGNLMEISKIALKFQDQMKPEAIDFLKKNKFSIFKMPAVQVFLFSTFFVALRKMCYYPLPSLRESSFLWLPSLAEKDPFYILPIVTGFTLFLTLRVGIDTGLSVASMSKWQKVFVYIMPVGSAFITMNFPSALGIYWCTANFYSLLLASLLKRPAVRQYFQLAERKVDTEAKPVKLSAIFKIGDLITSAKEAYRGHKTKSNIKSREHTDSVSFEKAGKGPLPRTYKYDPTNKRKL